MTSTPMYHPDDETQPHAEDQGESHTGAAHHSASGGLDTRSPETAERGDVRSQDGTAEDPVDAETRKLAHDEARQHDSAEDARRSPAEDGGEYGH